MSAAPDHQPDLQSDLQSDLGMDELMEVLDTLPSLVVVVDAEERNLYANRAARAWLGRTPAQLFGRAVREVLDPEEYAAVEHRIHAALAGTRQTFEQTVRLPGDAVAHTVTELLPRFRDGRPDGFIAVTADVTRRTRAEHAHAAARRREEVLLLANRTAAGVSDDVLQELFAIGLQLERMRRAPDEELGVVPLVEVLSGTIDRLRGAVKLLVAEGRRPVQDGTIASALAATGGRSVAGKGARRRDGTGMDVDDSVLELSIDECWDMLEADEFGRLAYRLVDEVHLVPINYVVDDRSLLFRTASGNKLLAAALHSDVALEIDWHDDLGAWSVVVRGQLRRLAEDEQHRIDNLPRQSWIPTLTYDVVELVPTTVTGRRFRLQRADPDHELAGL